MFINEQNSHNNIACSACNLIFVYGIKVEWCSHVQL